MSYIGLHTTSMLGFHNTALPRFGHSHHHSGKRSRILLLSIAVFVGLSLATTLLSIVSLHPGKSSQYMLPHELSASDKVAIRWEDNKRQFLVDKHDYIYQGKKEKWDAAPIVIESHKLVFFSIPKSGCTVFKRLFRRMMGVEDWMNQDGRLILPHNPKYNGLKYLHQYSLEKANEIMTSPHYTKAVFVRDPKLRFLSAFLDKALSNDGTFIKQNCCPNGECVKAAQTLVGFLDLVKWCKNEHWQHQSHRMEEKYWPLIDFIGHLENAANDTKQLLQQIGAWEEYGKSGWGKDGTLSIFESPKDAGGHATHAQWEIWKWYNNKLERQVEAFYKEDYDNPLFGFNITNLVDY